MRYSLGSATKITSTTRTRNAFMHFLSNYRQQHQRDCSKVPAWVIACDAAEAWAKMPLNDKYLFIEAARKTGYIYKSRDRRMNRVMGHLREAVKSDDKCDVLQLSSAVKQMQLWKRKVLEAMLEKMLKY